MAHLSHWKALQPGDTISIVAPGMAYDRELFDKSIPILKDWGYKIHVPKNILGKDTICSHSRKQRWIFLKEALASSSKVIWAARGGYGSLHLLPELSKYSKPRHTPLFIGFSDGVTLHQFFNQQWNWPTLHGPHIDRLSLLNPRRLKELQRVLSGEVRELEYKLKPLNVAAQKNQKIESSILGGNMVTLQSTAGTKLQLQGDGRILFFEEIGERAYKIDRILEHMDQLGVFSKCRAVLFGAFTGGNEPTGGNKIQAVLKNFASQKTIPVFSGLKIGHIPQSQSLPLNTKCHLQVRGGEAHLVVDTGMAR